jgi:hypothetical protein
MYGNYSISYIMHDLIMDLQIYYFPMGGKCRPCLAKLPSRSSAIADSLAVLPIPPLAMLVALVHHLQNRFAIFCEVRDGQSPGCEGVRRH